MFNIVKKSVKFGDNTLTIETGEIGRQADGAVMVTYGDTVVLVTAVGNKNAREGQHGAGEGRPAAGRRGVASRKGRAARGRRGAASSREERGGKP